MAEELNNEQLQSEIERISESPSIESEYEYVKSELERLKEFKDSDLRQIRLQVINLSQQVLIDRNKYKSINEREISAEDITNYANVLYSYVIS